MGGVIFYKFNMYSKNSMNVRYVVLRENNPLKQIICLLQIGSFV